MEHEVWVFHKDGYWYITHENHLTDCIENSHTSIEEDVSSLVGVPVTVTDSNGSVWWLEYQTK